MYNSAIRCIDLAQIDFGTITYRSEPLDEQKSQPVIDVEIR